MVTKNPAGIESDSGLAATASRDAQLEALVAQWFASAFTDAPSAPATDESDEDGSA